MSTKASGSKKAKQVSPAAASSTRKRVAASTVAIVKESPAVAVATDPAPVAAMVAPKVEPASAPAAAPVEVKEGTKIMTDTVKDTVSKIEETAKSNMAKGSEFVRELVEFGKGNVEAVVESGKIAAKGAQTMGQNAVEFGKKNIEATTAQFKQVAAVKSPTDFFKLQSDFARAQFDALVAEASKSTEMAVKLAGDVFQPLQNRYALAAEKVKTRLAA